MDDDTLLGFTCPRCQRTSYHPTDLAEGYCNACHDWTGVPAVGPNHWSAYQPSAPLPEYLEAGLAAIADEITPAMQAELRNLGVADPERYRVGFRSLPGALPPPED